MQGFVKKLILLTVWLDTQNITEKCTAMSMRITSTEEESMIK